jgi:hypothetical protein
LLEESQEEQLRKLKSTGLLDAQQVNECTTNWPLLFLCQKHIGEHGLTNITSVDFTLYFLLLLGFKASVIIPQVPTTYNISLICACFHVHRFCAMRMVSKLDFVFPLFFGCLIPLLLDLIHPYPNCLMFILLSFQFSKEKFRMWLVVQQFVNASTLNFHCDVL